MVQFLYNITNRPDDVLMTFQMVTWFYDNTGAIKYRFILITYVQMDHIGRRVESCALSPKRKSLIEHG